MAGVVVAVSAGSDEPAAVALPQPTAQPAASEPDSGQPSAWQPSPEHVADPLDELAVDFDVLDEVGLDDEAAFEDGVQARLVSVERSEVSARGPGESAGSGVLVTVEIENPTTEPIDLDAVVVDFYDDAESPAVVNYGDERSDVFAGSLEPGQSARATYVAHLASPTTTVTVTVSYAPGAPAVSFSGKL